MRPRATAGANIRPRIFDCRSASVWTATGVGVGLDVTTLMGLASGVGVGLRSGVGVGVMRTLVSADTETPDTIPAAIAIKIIAEKLKTFR